MLLDEGWTDAEVPSLVRYANARGVRLVLWTRWRALRDPAERERLLARWAAWGVAGIKADFLLSDSSARMAVCDDIARDAARHRLVVDFHGGTIPRGIQRTWPNVLTLEAVEGAERETPGQGSRAIEPRHDVDLAFIRNVVGSMDYTPVTFSAPNRSTSAGHRLAQAVVYESGLQHFADTPESYADHPRALTLLRELPVAWDDVRLIAGAPDREVVLARRDGDRWWIGSLSALPAHEQTVPLDFLGHDRRYAMHIVRDDGSGGLAEEHRMVGADDHATVWTDRAGGWAAELVPQG